VRRAVAVLLAASALLGCGNERAPVPDLSEPAEPVGTQPVELSGIRFTAPANWTVLPPRGEMVGGLQSGTATLAVWRYPRTEPLPEGDEALLAAKARLESQVRRRDPGFAFRSVELTRRGDADAIEVTGEQTIAGTRYGVRSAHVFHEGTEVVVDAYAPPGTFEAADASVFQPILESLDLP
jgi:hypothetical protein